MGRRSHPWDLPDTDLFITLVLLTSTIFYMTTATETNQLRRKLGFISSAEQIAKPREQIKPTKLDNSDPLIFVFLSPNV